MKKLAFSVSIIVILFFLYSCGTVQVYERQYISDPEIQMGNDVGKGFDNYVYSVREGSIPAESNKTSGGCGCN